MSESEKQEGIEVNIAVPTDEVLEEINAISLHLHARLDGLEDFEEMRKKQAQILALGALFFKLVDDNPPDNKKMYTEIVTDLANSIDVGSS